MSNGRKRTTCCSEAIEAFLALHFDAGQHALWTRLPEGNRRISRRMTAGFEQRTRGGNVAPGALAYQGVLAP